MVSEELTAQKLRELLDYNPETGVFVRKIGVATTNAGDVVGSNVNGYLSVKIKNKPYYLHRLAWLYVYGEFPSGEIDHINRNKKDNKIDNLRNVTRQQNTQNRTVTSGVFQTKNKRRWRARISVSNKTINIGTFETKELALAEYKKAKKLYHPFFYE